MTYPPAARTAAVTAALKELRGPDSRIPHPDQPEEQAVRTSRLLDLEKQLLELAWSTLNTQNKPPAPTMVAFSSAVARAQHWIDTALAPALGVLPGERVCDPLLLRGLRAAVVVLRLTRPEDYEDRASRLVGTATSTAHAHGHPGMPVRSDV